MGYEATLVYSRKIDSCLYLPDYPIARLIAHQIEEHMRTASSTGQNEL